MSKNKKQNERNNVKKFQQAPNSKKKKKKIKDKIRKKNEKKENKKISTIINEELKQNKRIKKTKTIKTPLKAKKTIIKNIRNIFEDINKSNEFLSDYLEFKNELYLKKSLSYNETSIEANKELIKLEYNHYLKHQNENIFFKNVQKALIILTPQEIKNLIPINSFDDKILKKTFKEYLKNMLEYFNRIQIKRRNLQEKIMLIEEIKKEINEIIPIENCFELVNYPFFFEGGSTNFFYYNLMKCLFLNIEKFISSISSMKGNKIIYHSILDLLKSKSQINLNQLSYLITSSLGEIDETYANYYIMTLQKNHKNSKKDIQKFIEKIKDKEYFVSLEKKKNSNLLTISNQENLKDDVYSIDLNELNLDIIKDKLPQKIRNISNLIHSFESARKFDFLKNNIYQPYINHIIKYIAFISNSPLMRIYYKEVYKSQIYFQNDFLEELLRNNIKLLPIYDEEITGYMNRANYGIILNSIPRQLLSESKSIDIKLYKFLLIGEICFTLHHESNIHFLRRLINLDYPEINRDTPINEMFKTNKNYYDAGNAFEKNYFGFSTKNTVMISYQECFFFMINDNWKINNVNDFKKRLHTQYSFKEIKKYLKNENLFLTIICNMLNIHVEDFFEDNSELKDDILSYSKIRPNVPLIVHGHCVKIC